MSVLKKEFTPFIAVLLCAVLFFSAGCKKEEEPKGRRGNILYFSYLGSTADRVADGSLTGSFSEETGILVMRNSVMPADVLNHKRDYLSGTQTPDLLTWIKTGEDADFARDGLFLDLEELWTDEEWIQKYPAAVQGACRAGSTLFMMPFKIDTWKIYYRKSIFDDHNLAEPRTWDEFLSVCATLSEAGIFPVAMGAKLRWPAALWIEYINIRLNGSSFHHDLMRGTIPFDWDRIEKVLRHFTLLVESDVFIPETRTLSWASALKDFREKRAAMYLFNDSILNSLPPDIEADVDSFQFPLINMQLPSTFLGTVQGWVVPRTAQNSDDALRFLQYCGSEQGQNELAKIPDTPLRQNGDQELFGGADSVLPELNRLAFPEQKEAFLAGTAALLEDPSEGTIDRVLAQMEQAW